MQCRLPQHGPLRERDIRRLSPIARLHGVTLEHLVEVIRARREYRRAASARRRHRRNYRMKGRVSTRALFIKDPQTHIALGEGELHSLLKTAGMTPTEFSRLAGIECEAFYRWYGHPLHDWAKQLVRQHIIITRMRADLEKLGVKDFEQYNPKMLPPMPGPNYPRKVSDLKLLRNTEDDKDWSPWKKK